MNRCRYCSAAVGYDFHPYSAETIDGETTYFHDTCKGNQGKFLSNSEIVENEAVCANCRYWQAPSPEDHFPIILGDSYGCCKRLSVGYDGFFSGDVISSQMPALVGFDDTGKMAVIVTRPEFGCTTFEVAA